MATTISTKNASDVAIFPEALTSEMFNLVRGKSSLARLSGSAPIPFNGERVFTFNFDNEVSIVAENAAKVNGGGVVDFVSMVPVKVEYGMRVSDEFRFAAADVCGLMCSGMVGKNIKTILYEFYLYAIIITYK